MSSFTTKTPPPYLRRPNYHNRVNPPFSVICCVGESQQDGFTRRRALTSLITLTAIGAVATSSALAQEKWGTRSFIKEKYFQPGLSPEDAAARIKQTAEGLRDMREMLDHMSWRYVIFYIRLKQAYLSQDLTNAMNILPESRRNDYVQAANQLVENMSEVKSGLELIGDIWSILGILGRFGRELYSLFDYLMLHRSTRIVHRSMQSRDGPYASA